MSVTSSITFHLIITFGVLCICFQLHFELKLALVLSVFLTQETLLSPNLTNLLPDPANSKTAVPCTITVLGSVNRIETIQVLTISIFVSMVLLTVMALVALKSEMARYAIPWDWLKVNSLMSRMSASVVFVKIQISKTEF